MFGRNKRLRKASGDGRFLSINEAFYSIQGEGPFAGEPAFFIRLAGCNLACTWCDTDFDAGEHISIEALHDTARQYADRTDLIVITGGEPLRQNIARLVKLEGYRIQIETAGTYWNEALLDPNITLVCSPKTPRVHPMIQRHCWHWKYVIEAGNVADDGLPETCPDPKIKQPPARPENPASVIYLSPCDEYNQERNESNRQAVIASALQHGYCAGLQLHKEYGVR